MKPESKPAKPVSTRTTPQSRIGVNTSKPRPVWKRPEFVLLTQGRQYCVVGGHMTRMIDNRQPYVGAMRIMQHLKLVPAQCLMVDERETTRIESCRKAGMKIVTVADWEAGKLLPETTQDQAES